MIWLLRDFDLLSVLIRGVALSFEVLTLGGIAFLLIAGLRANASEPVRRGCWRGIRWAATGLFLAEIASVGIDTAILMGGSALHFADVVAAPYFIAGTIAALATLAVVTCAAFRGRIATLLLGPLAILILLAAVAGSHAVSRMDHRVALVALTAAHHVGAAIWIGAIPFLLIGMRRSEDVGEAKRLLVKFSPMAIAGAGMLLLGGIGMGWVYLGVSADKSLSGLYGTAYGVMLLAKIYLLVLIVTLGAGNFFLVRRIETAPESLLRRLRRFGEAEIGLAFTAILAAASMTSQPPAVDLPADRATLAEIGARFRPEWPRLTSPSFAELAPSTPIQIAVKEMQFNGASAPSDSNDEAWSEYNHHWAGLIVLAAGIFALLSRLPRTRWARNWPLVFAGLAVFIVLRADPDCWPLGPRSFWASFYAPDVLQHRLYALLILAFAAFEWGVQTERLHSKSATMVFPVLCAVAGALLLTHNHSIGNVKEELLAEMSHTPIALLGATAGWSRWLELRLPGQKESRLASFVWPASLILVGLVLLNYRES
ncbi:Copper resistance protein D [Acidisarcina polymorpha]|uniref:Copper resistance protein D n=1 Tax=Acidisarcina polymorpha TaxID=2211140 RepID=A0A2Z5G6I9_9BACT|nr:CopD family protein [Acidisarcina polymorpha]AXC14599.1 Copper resistance protein D [Acidisarcina polymorpha]